MLTLTIQFVYDTYALAHVTGGALTKSGGKTWFFITADYAFGYALERDTSAAVEAAGGKMLGAVRAPLGTADFSSYLVQASHPARRSSASPMPAPTCRTASSSPPSSG